LETLGTGWWLVFAPGHPWAINDVEERLDVLGLVMLVTLSILETSAREFVRNGMQRGKPMQIAANRRPDRRVKRLS